MGDFMSQLDLADYWDTQRDRHTTILKASGAIK